MHNYIVFFKLAGGRKLVAANETAAKQLGNQLCPQGDEVVDVLLNDPAPCIHAEYLKLCTY